MKINLNNWQFKRTDTQTWLSAAVPGSVYNDLLQCGAMGDPFYRDNEDAALELAGYDYEYTAAFRVDKVDYPIINLVCDGIDTIADIFINEKLVAKTRNMHRGYRFDVKEYLKQGENRIRVVLFSPTEYITRKHAENPLCMSAHTGTIDGYTHLRKAHYMFGWDWGPKLPDMGIWRDIYIECLDEKINDCHIRQTHADGRVALDIVVDSTDNGLVKVEITSPVGEKYFGAGGESRVVIENPMLWRHTGFGAQHLYHVRVTLGDFDAREFKIGLRTLAVNTEKDEWGQKFCLNINGKDIFAMGGNYIPEDSVLARMSPERTRRLLTDCVKANHNAVRVWGGGIYLPDYFYDICDELGLIVWQDFMFAGGVYDFDDIGGEVAAEVEYNIKRLRHHASIALWCGNNELEEGWACWGWDGAYKKKYKADYIKLFEHVIPNLVKEHDPDRFYWPSSPSSYGGFDDPYDENVGDRHYWDVWHGLKPFADYKRHYFRFLSEFGFQSFPDMKTVESFTLHEDRNIFSYVMEKHQKNGGANAKILQYLAQTYQYPADLDGLVYLSQLMQAEAMRFGIEHFRRNRGRCMGTLYWQTNDCWPVASWSGIDCYGRWKALHYKAKRFFAPVLLSADVEENKASLVVVNDSNTDVDATVVWRIVTAGGDSAASGEYDVTVGSLGRSEAVSLDFSRFMPDYKSMMDYVFSYKLIVGGEEMSSECQLFVPPKHFNYKEPHISVRLNDGGDLEVSADAFAQDIELSAKEGDVLFDDNYFSLLPGEVRVITPDRAVDADNLRIRSVENV